jgi:hypothetical protein
MTSGYLLRDVINKVHGIHFTAQEELFTLGSLYEPMLKEMRDAAGDNMKKDDDGNLVSVNLDIKNPNAAEALEHLPPEQLVEDILAKERRIIEIMGEIKAVLAKGGG